MTCGAQQISADVDSVIVTTAHARCTQVKSLRNVTQIFLKTFLMENCTLWWIHEIAGRVDAPGFNCC